jgi:hypothetical protein
MYMCVCEEAPFVLTVNLSQHFAYQCTFQSSSCVGYVTDRLSIETTFTLKVEKTRH